MQPNKAFIRPHYTIRALDDVLIQVSGSKYFSKVDASSGYWTAMLSPESSLLTTFNTEFVWESPQAQAFQKVKDLIARTPGPLLICFDASKLVILET